ncbi:MAG: proton-conducting transporter membrane subunit [Alphaproteobacteria bacterium]
MSNILLALLLLPPLFAAITTATSLYMGDRWLSWRQVQKITLIATGLSALGGIGMLILFLFEPQPMTVTLMSWFEMGGKSIDVAFLLDPLSALMVALGGSYGFIICRFSINYMHNEVGFTRFFAGYALFVVAMLILVLADNLVLMFMGWEVVGLCSYLLIGHYNSRLSAARAGTEAFVLNRIGDAGMILGMLTLFIGTGTVKFSELPTALATAEAWVAPTAALCLLIGAMGKSGQVPLSGWLSRAMEGPTPTSALFHGSVMVIVGIYLIVRANALFEAAPAVLALAAIVGAITVLYGALGAQAASDVKGILVYSTIMHLGVMFVACGLGAYGVAVFYMLAHALYKGYQFITAPSILHHLHGKLDFENHEASIPVSSGVTVMLLVAIGMMLIPPLLALSGIGSGGITAFWAFAGATILALALLIWLAIDAARYAAPHSHEHNHEGHSHESQARKLGPAGAAAITVFIAAFLGMIVQFLPGGVEGSWFNDFLRLPQGEGATAAPSLAVLLSLFLAFLALHSTLSALLLTRHASEEILANHPALRVLYATAANRMWIDGIIQMRILPTIQKISEWLERFDARLTHRIINTSSCVVQRAAMVVEWVDTVLRKGAERIPSLIGLHVAEASSDVEKNVTEGFEKVINRTFASMGRTGLLFERIFSRPSVSIGLIIVVALLALIGV